MTKIPIARIFKFIISQNNPCISNNLKLSKEFSKIPPQLLSIVYRLGVPFFITILAFSGKIYSSVPCSVNLVVPPGHKTSQVSLTSVLSKDRTETCSVPLIEHFPVKVLPFLHLISASGLP
uniref:Ovule protein n=1 Tax=Meloidogyne hapla TaxID=6305 RepID=A0A1I8BJK3_MELHA